MTPPPLGRDARGVVMLEFLVAFLPVLVLFLGALQLALLGAAQLVVQHAAIAGARSAAVVLDDDPARYDGEARGVLTGGRMAAIGRAVRAPLGGLPAYRPETTGIALAAGPGDAPIAGDVLEDAQVVTVHVEHLEPCLVPIVRTLACPTLALPDGVTRIRAVQLRGAATMPRFGARYLYPSERERGGDES